MKFNGTLEDLLTIIRGCGFSPDQVIDQEHGHQVRTIEGAIVNWYPSKGTLVFQGPRAPREQLQSAWSSYTGVAERGSTVNTAEPIPAPSAPANIITANKKVLLYTAMIQQRANN